MSDFAEPFLVIDTHSTVSMDSHIADDKLKELHVEDTAVKANRDALQYEIDPAAEKKLLRKIDLHVVPILWFLFMYVI